MGIAIAAVYLPLLAVISAIAIAISIIPVRAARGHPIRLIPKIIAYASGSLAALTLTSFYAWWYSTRATNEWSPLIGSLAISLVGPSVVGLVMLVIWMAVGRTRPTSFNYAVSGAWQSTIAMPVFGILIFIFYDDVVHKPTFDQLCEKAGLAVLEVVPPARSVAFIPEAFVTSNRTGGAHQNARVLLFPSGTPLQYVEAKVRDWNGKDRLVRVTYAKEQADAPSDPSKPRKTFTETPIDALSADYRVTPTKLEVPASLAERTYGQRIEVTRLSDGKLISRAQYYWDTGKWWECPVGVSEGSFVADFIARSLNLPTRK
jgi:hypothetical protein